MNNIYGLPEKALVTIRERDRHCVYCGKSMVDPGTPGKTQRDWATIEHLNHLPPWDNPETVAYCCGSCNSSRGAKPILVWFNSSYCSENNINPKTVSKVVLDYIRKYEGYEE